MSQTLRITNNVGRSSGYGVNCGYNYGEISYTFPQTSGTISCTTNQQISFLYLLNPPTGNINIVINGSASQVFDECTILFPNCAATYSITYNNAISSDNQLSITQTLITTSVTASIPGTSSVTTAIISYTYSSISYSNSFTVPNGASVVYKGVYDGNKFRGSTHIQGE